jgi:O-antigen/teichoic acid export membrane protein
LILSNALLIALNTIYILKRTRFSSKNLQVQKHFKSLSFFFITTAAVSLYTYFDTIILGMTVGSLAVGFYTTGLKVIRLSQNFVDSIGNVLLPRVSLLKESEQYTDIDRIVNKSLQYVLFVSIPLCIFFYIAAPEIIKIVAGNDFNASISVLRLLTLLPLLIGLSNIFGMQVLVPFKHESKTAIAVVLGSFLSVSLNIILCPLLKEDGAALACVTTEFAVTLILYFFVRKEVHLNIRWTEVLKTILCALLFFPIVTHCRTYEVHLLVTFVVSGILCFTSYVLLQYFLFKNSIILEVIHFIKTTR